eukprot:gnl/MRDRNA2_/MRDRNA2_94299_c0_seq1.p1 gnl/MRDRNA2_/MRDRNA2_94299_c0~~gnl/MRDRNA2_/MRDRNA2_94299_c0_seq1.p1  ORF type:complete len:269 (+),score=68.96 gnl/MRDRNA2_/MRDRNA2_94299_c0_seq1:90-896(+)
MAMAGLSYDASPHPEELISLHPNSFGEVGRKLAEAIAMMCDSSKVPLKRKGQRCSAKQPRAVLKPIAEGEEVETAVRDYVEEMRHQMVKNGQKIVNLSRAVRDRQEVLEWQKKLLDEKDRQIQNLENELAMSKDRAAIMSKALNEKQAILVDEMLQSEWQQSLLEEKDREMQKLSLQLYKLRKAPGLSVHVQPMMQLQESIHTKIPRKFSDATTTADISPRLGDALSLPESPHFWPEPELHIPESPQFWPEPEPALDSVSVQADVHLA